MSFDVLVTHPRLDPPGLALLEQAGCRVQFLPPEGGRVEMERLLAATRFDGVVSRMVPISAAAMDLCPSLRVISRAAAGYDAVDVAAATARGIRVMTAVGANAQSVAEFTIGLMIAVARNLPRHDAAIRAGGWERWRLGLELQGRRLGLVGYGQIARAVARMALGIGMRVSAWSPRLAQAGAIAPVQPAASLHDLLAQSDVVSLHAPLGERSRGMIGAAELALLPPEAILLNTARGGLVDEAALAAALREGRLWGAGIDTFTAEPPPADHPLLALPNVVMSPHVGAATEAARARTAEVAARHLLDVLLARPLPRQALVNPEVLADS